MDPYLNFSPSSQASGNGYAQTTQNVGQDSCAPFFLEESASNYFPTVSPRSYTLLGHDGGPSQVPQNAGINSAQPFHSSMGSRFVTLPSSRSSHPYQEARLCHLADRTYAARHQEWSPPPFPTVSAPAPALDTVTPYNAVFNSRPSNRSHQSSQAPPVARKRDLAPAFGPGSQCTVVASNTNQNMNMSSFTGSFTVPRQPFPSAYQISAPLPCTPVDQADIEFARHRYGGKRTLYQCRFDLAGSPCNKWIVGDRTRVLRHLRNHHHLQTGPATPAVCRWEKCTHSRAMKQENLSRHIVMHLGVKWKCPHCRRLFSRDDAVHRHIERMVPGMDVTEAEVVPGCEARAITDPEFRSARSG